MKKLNHSSGGFIKSFTPYIITELDNGAFIGKVVFLGITTNNKENKNQANFYMKS